MRKIITALVLAMVFVGLAPFAVAEDQPRTGERISTSDAIGNATSEGNATPEPLAAGQIANRTEPIANRTGPIVNRTIQLREIASARLELARQRYIAAKNRYSTARQAYVHARTRLNATKEVYRACKGNTTEECIQVRKETRVNTREFLLKTEDRVISMLEKIKERIEMSEYISEEDAEIRIAEIDARIAELEDSKDVIENLDSESTPAEIRAAVNTIKQAWLKARVPMKRNVGRLLNAKIGGIIVKSAKLGERLERAKELLAEKGYETDDIEELLGEFNGHVESAEESYRMARGKYSEAVTPREVDEAMKEANTHMREAHKELKEAHAVLVKILRQIKATKNGESALEEAEEEDTGV